MENKEPKIIKVRTTQFREGCAESFTMSQWKEKYADLMKTKILIESDIEEAYYLCGGKKTKKSENKEK